MPPERTTNVSSQQSARLYVWLIHLDKIRPVASELSEAESARAARFKFDRDRDRYIASHTVLRQLQSEHDAPHWSLSRSGGLALIATAPARVGIDIEEIRNESPDFYQAWTRKEAYLKATGEGLTDANVHAEIAPDPSWSVVDLDVPAGYAGALAVQLADYLIESVTLP
jgi:4'-phosphopantetheinyl transferase